MNIKDIMFFFIVLFSLSFSKLIAMQDNIAHSDTTTIQSSTVQLENDSLNNKPNLNINLSSGLISNSTFGIHPIINIAVGMRQSSNSFSLTYEYRFGHSRNNYQIIDDGILKNASVYNSKYFGFEYQKQIVRNPYNELYTLAGIGYDWFVITKSDVIMNDKKLGGIALNIGLGYAFYFEAKHGPTIQILYHYANIVNNNGTKFNPSSVLIRISYLFGNDFDENNS